MRPIVLSNKLCDNVLVNEDTVSNKLAVAVGHVTVEQIDAAFNNPTTGLKQLIERVAAKKCDCAKTMCGGHGRCHGVGVAVVVVLLVLRLSRRVVASTNRINIRITGRIS